MSKLIKMPQLISPVAERDHIKGPLSAPIVLIEYGDFECPYCGQAYSLVKTLQDRLDDRLCFVFRHFPLINSHPHAQHAAELAEGAGHRGKFWEMHDYLFQHQDALTDNDLCAYARSLDLDAAGCMREVFSGLHTSDVREDIQSGAEGGVTGTPTFFLNGRRYDGALALHKLLAESAPPLLSAGAHNRLMRLHE